MFICHQRVQVHMDLFLTCLYLLFILVYLYLFILVYIFLFIYAYCFILFNQWESNLHILPNEFQAVSLLITCFVRYRILQWRVALHNGIDCCTLHSTTALHSSILHQVIFPMITDKRRIEWMGASGWHKYFLSNINIIDTQKCARKHLSKTNLNCDTCPEGFKHNGV